MWFRYVAPVVGRVGLAVIVAVTHVALLLAQDTDDRAPPPGEAAQAKALQLLREVYDQERKQAKTFAQKQALADKLFHEALQSQDLTDRFVLFRVSADVATEAGDVETAFRAIDRTAEDFRVDGLQMKVEALAGAARSAGSVEHRKVVTEQSMALIDQAVDDDNFTAADRLGKLALATARKARDLALVKQIVARNKEVEKIEKAYAAAQKALVTLDEKPTDPEANFTVGRFYCLIKGDWDDGLPMLALGSDPALRELATRELQGAPKPEDQVALGDAWWDWAEEEAGTSTERGQGRAAYWYERAAPQLSGLEKARIEKRIQEVADAAAGQPKTAPRTSRARRLRDRFVRLHILARIDGTDEIHLFNDRAQWAHRTHAWPKAVAINGLPWSPKDTPVAEYVKAGLRPLEGVDFSSAQFLKIRGRGPIHLKPAEDHLVITFDDKSGAGADTYEIIVVLKRER